MDNKQLFKNGDIVETDGVKLECSFVSYQEIDGKKVNFTYSFRPQDDMERERKETRIPDVGNNKQES